MAVLLTQAASASADVWLAWVQLTCIYLFHELPPQARRDVAKEMARVVKPGGMVRLVEMMLLQAVRLETAHACLPLVPAGCCPARRQLSWCWL